MGRAFTPEQKAKACEEILAKVRGGMSLRAACESGDDWTPTEGAFRAWCDSDPDLLTQYTRAREDRAEKIFEECLTIADSQEGDVIKVDGTDQPNHDLIQRAKLRIDTRKWMLGKMQPKVYGEKMLHGSDPENPLPSQTAVTINMTPEQAAEAYASAINPEGE